MDAPPEREDCRPFVHVAALLARAGLNAPRVLAQDLARGFLLLTDLGATTYLAALERDRAVADRLFADATDALVSWQLASRRDELPPYDAALLRRELELFPEWYVGRHLGVTLSPAERETIERAFALIVGANLAQPQVFVHRDYMPRNLMVCEPNPGILDFQDAVYGPITYDVACLVKDAFISWEEERVLDWTIRYWEKAKRAQPAGRRRLRRVLARLRMDGAAAPPEGGGDLRAARVPRRQAPVPRGHAALLGYIRPVLARYRALAPLAALLDRLEERARAARYSISEARHDSCAARHGRADAPAHRRDAEAAARGRRQAARRRGSSSASPRRATASSCINHAHLGGMIEAALGDGARFGVRIRYSPEPRSARDRRRHRECPPAPRAGAVRSWSTPTCTPTIRSTHLRGALARRTRSHISSSSTTRRTIRAAISRSPAGRVGEPGRRDAHVQRHRRLPAGAVRRHRARHARAARPAAARGRGPRAR